VADNHIAAPRIAEHPRCHFAGECPLGLLVDVLGGERDFRAPQDRGDRGKGRKGGGDYHFPVRRHLQLHHQEAGEFHRLSGGFEHLPVADNQR